MHVVPHAPVAHPDLFGDLARGQAESGRAAGQRASHPAQPGQPPQFRREAGQRPIAQQVGQAGSQRKPLLSPQMMASPFPAIPLMPASACGQNSPGS